MEKYRIALVSINDKKTIESTFLLKDNYQLTVTFGYKRLKTHGLDYFECLCKMRKKLEKKGLRPKCFGASRNVYPSGMCRSMGGGRSAYKMTLGKHVDLCDIVDIFASNDDTEAVSIEEQLLFYNEWSKSIENVDEEE